MKENLKIGKEKDLENLVIKMVVIIILVNG
jgi:hypothetical protein